MEKETQFKIETEEELEQAYNYFKDDWMLNTSLEDEVNYFHRNNKHRWTVKNLAGRVFLCHRNPNYTVVQNPLKSTEGHHKKTDFYTSKIKPLGSFPRDGSDEICVFDSSIEYVQNGDANQSDGGMQSLKVSGNSSGGDYFLTIKTDRWSFDDIDDLINIVKDFKKRMK